MTRIRLFALVVAFGTASAVTAAIVIAIVDLYVTGHGGESLTREWFSWRPLFALSPADVIVLAAGVAGVVVALLVGRRSFRSTGARRLP